MKNINLCHHSDEIPSQGVCKQNIPVLDAINSAYQTVLTNFYRQVSKISNDKFILLAAFLTLRYTGRVEL